MLWTSVVGVGAVYVLSAKVSRIESHLGHLGVRVTELARVKDNW